MQRKHQAGMTLVEFMVAIAIGMLLVAGLATLIANQSQSRTEVDRAGRLIENGRYAMSQIAADLQMAGYYGEMGSTLIPGIASSNTMPDPCSTSPSTIMASIGMHVQGYNNLASLPSDLAACVKNQRPGTDILVIRRADPDTSDLETSGAVDFAKLKAGQVYLQTGLPQIGSSLTGLMAAANGSTDSSTFNLYKRGKTVKSTPRRMLVRIYYIARCSVEVSGSCTNGDGGTPIPTLKRVDLSYSGTSTAFTTVTIAEGIENLHFEYAVDTDGDGYTDGSDQTGATCNATADNTACAGGAFTTTDWTNVMGASVYLLARSSEKVPGFTDTNTYQLGSNAAAAAPAGDEGYRRRVFSQSVKLMNPAGRRAF